MGKIPFPRKSAEERDGQRAVVRLRLHAHEPLLAEIEATPSLSPYLDDVMHFLDYLQRVEDKRITPRMVEGLYPELKVSAFSFRYPHRWRDEYRKMIVAKTYDLQRALMVLRKGTPLYVTLLSLGTYQRGRVSRKRTGGDGYTIPESFEKLSFYGRRLMDRVRRYVVPGLMFFWVLEPHKSGYPHRHYLLLTPEPLTEGQIKEMKRLWSKVYGVGHPTYGVNCSVSPNPDPVRSVKDYILKYMKKTFEPSEQTPAGLVFNALALKHHYRLYGASRDISRMMKKSANPEALAEVMEDRAAGGPDPSPRWLDTSLTDPLGESHTIKACKDAELILSAIEGQDRERARIARQVPGFGVVS